MKKIYFLAIALFYVNSLCTTGQDVITGGDMEDSEAWEISLLNTDGDNDVIYEEPKLKWHEKIMRWWDVVYICARGYTDEFMKKMGQVGKLHYFPEFMRPFFKIITSDGLQIKGIIGENNFEITYPRTQKWEKKVKFEKNLELFLQEMI